MNCLKQVFRKIPIIAGILGGVCLLANSTSAAWTDHVKVSGDLRYRHEYIDKQDSDSRTRHRIRGRLSITGEVNDWIDLHVRLASGSSDPVSTNQTLNDGFSSKSLYLDKAYFDVHPTDHFHFLGGKMGNPFFKPMKSELIWDGDLTPEGLALTTSFGSGPVSFFINAGGFWVEERKADDDSMLFGGQLGARFKLGENGKLVAGGSVFSYTEAEGWAPYVDAGDSFGNSTTTKDDGDLIYATDFTEVEGFVEFSTKFGNVPFYLFGDYVVNTDADEDDTGYLAGFQIGKAKAQWSWQLQYNYRSLEADAVVGAFTNSDFGGGGTNADGHMISAGLAVAKNWSIGVTYLMNTIDPDGAELDYNRAQLDLKFKF